MVQWDSQVKDGYRRSQAPARDEDGGDAHSERGDAPPKPRPEPARASWDAERRGDVVEQLLKNSTDKAYGANGTGAHYGMAAATAHNGMAAATAHYGMASAHYGMAAAHYGMAYDCGSLWDGL